MTGRRPAEKNRPPQHLGGAVLARVLSLIAVGYTIAAASPAAVCAHQAAPVGVDLGMYGAPESAAQYWREQSTTDCGEMAVADVVGEMTGRQPTESEIVRLAENTPSVAGRGPIWQPTGFTDIRDLPILLSHFGIATENTQTDVDSLKRQLAAGHKVIAIVNAEIIWDRPITSDVGNHFVVVTGIDTRSGTVHLNDSAVRTGRDETVSVTTFERAWAPNYRSAIVTR